MKKSLVIIIVAIAAVFAFASCKAVTVPAEEQASEQQAEAAVDETVEDAQPAEDEAVNETDFGARGALAAQEYTLEEMLEYAIQDEYLARQEYESIMEEYGEINPFANIIKAEEYHIELLTGLYDDYDLELPEDTAINYVVVPENLDLTYDIGVQAEIDNIAMYEKFLEQDLPDDVRAVFIELRDASENHLAAFEKGPRGAGQGNGNGNG